MRILYAATKYDYGVRERGLSFEHTNFFDCLHHMGHNILYFDYMALMQKHGRDWMNRRLEELVKAEKPDLLFAFLTEEELDRETMSRISDGGDTITFNWFADDTTRFDNFTRSWAPRFHWVATTAQNALPKYAEIGYKNVIKSQWAVNPFSYRHFDLPLKYDVTFVGQPHSDRRQVIDSLRASGVSVTAWGHGWECGRLSQDGMIEVFNQSRINLNLSNWGEPEPGRISRATNRLLNFLPKASLARRAMTHGAYLACQTPLIKRINQPSTVQRYTSQIKGRNFEVPGCGGFMLTGTAENLEDYYRSGEEVVCYESTEQMIDKVHHYLKHEDKRAAVADAGYRRTLAEHTYVHRFTEIFQRIGLSCQPVETLLMGNVPTGSVEEVPV